MSEELEAEVQRLRTQTEAQQRQIVRLQGLVEAVRLVDPELLRRIEEGEL